MTYQGLKMNVRTIFIGLLILLLIVPVANVSASPGYNMTVFSPNNVIYDIKLLGIVKVYNTSTQDLMGSQKISINGTITLISKRIDINYYAWGANLSISYLVAENNTIKSQSAIQIPVPPILAIKVGTRQIYLTQIVMDVLQGKIENITENITFSDIMRRIAFNKPVPGFYIYNPFYIPTDSRIGDKIPYGFYNETMRKGLIINGSVIGEETISIPEGTFNTWLVRISEEEVLKAIEYFIEEEIELPEEVNFSLDLFYEKQSGWLLKGISIAHGSGIEEDENVTITVDISGELELENSGTVMIGGKTFFDKMIGAPPYTTIAIESLVIVGVLIYVVRRRY